MYIHMELVSESNHLLSTLYLSILNLVVLYILYASAEGVAQISENVAGCLFLSEKRGILDIYIK